MTGSAEARAGNPATLAELGNPHGPVDRTTIQAWLAHNHGFHTWAELVDAVAFRTVLNDRDIDQLAAVLAADPRRASAELTGWCDHKCGVAPLNYITMLRFDAPRLGLSGDLPGIDDIARQLLDAGAPVNGHPDDRETPLMTAASYGDVAVAQVLIDAGADLDAHAAADAGGVPGGTALRHAAVFGMTNVLDALVAAGAAVESFPRPPPLATSPTGRSPTPPPTNNSAHSSWPPTTNASTSSAPSSLTASQSTAPILAGAAIHCAPPPATADPSASRSCSSSAPTPHSPNPEPA
jgi:ankyrin repeat protein